MNNNTIAQVVKDELCTGCGTCIALCPEEAIKLTINEKKGIYVPELNEGRCNECGICFNVCPGHEVDFKGLNLEVFGKEPEDILIGNYLNCYVGHSTDYDVRYNSASGGLITQLLIFALEEGIIDGALVTRMKKDKPLEPEPFIARTKEGIIEASKSKYCPVPANIALKEILNSKEGGKFAVVGLPCHIHGIRKAEQINKKLKQKIVLHLGLWCSTTCNFLGTEFVLKRLGVSKEAVKELNYRGEGWPGGMSVQLKNGEKRFIPLGDYWDTNFSSFRPSRCRLCSDAIAEFADICFGDYRGQSAYLNEKIGNSDIISRTITSENILQRMLSKQKIEIWRVSSSDVATSQGYFHSKKNVKACFHLFRLLGKKIPIYNQELLKPPLITYLWELDLHLRTLLASRRCLWGLLKVYTFIYTLILEFGSYVKSKLKR
ncbi:MAG: Coenzyme F420 hydrogenase/dehydrogenase, beta subunit C-terminal domain [Halobacteriota archaeon]